MADVKRGDLVSCKQRLVIGGINSEGSHILVARPGDPRSLFGRPTISEGKLGLVVSDPIGSSDLIGVLIEDQIYAVWPQHLRVLQAYEECDAN